MTGAKVFTLSMVWQTDYGKPIFFSGERQAMSGNDLFC
jgi:hypothetical protein